MQVSCPGFINTAVTLSSLGPDGSLIGKNSVARKGHVAGRIGTKISSKTRKDESTKEHRYWKYERFFLFH